MEKSRTREKLSPLRQRIQRPRRRIWRLSSVRKIPRTAAASRETVRHSARHVPDSRERVRLREHAPHNREHARYREPVPPETVRRVPRREHARQEREDQRETVRCVLRDLHREHARQEREDRRETARHALTARRAQTDSRGDVLSVMEDRAARREAKEEGATRDRAELPGETEEIPAGTI